MEIIIASCPCGWGLRRDFALYVLSNSLSADCSEFLDWQCSQFAAPADTCINTTCSLFFLFSGITLLEVVT